jgi:hypothetical protein
MPGIDRRGGVSYVVWTGDVPKSVSEFGDAPEWLLDEAVVRSASEFDGPTDEWYKKLVDGPPNLRVRNAIARIKDDMGYSEMVAAQFEAVRLGAEGNPGVPTLIEALETQWLSRPTENHTTPESKWESDFARALASGIEKFGGAIDILNKMPDYNLSMIPTQIPLRLVAGDPGDKDTFRQLMMELLPVVDDDLTVLSVLWNCPTTKEVSREQGLEFVYKRITDARQTPEPKKTENPTLDRREQFEGASLMTDEERGYVLDHPTFVDDYLEAASTRGFVQEAYDVPCAWTVLSMMFGYRAVIPITGRGLGVNLWFMSLGGSGTGKTEAMDFMTSVLNLLLKTGDETFYNLGANSSPEALHEALLDRDAKSSIILHDEASDFFDNLKRKDWMMTLKDLFSKWYNGFVDPQRKVRLKENSGKSATTSFNIHMSATPNRLLGLIDTSMFETGFLARFNWSYGPMESADDTKYMVQIHDMNADRLNPRAYDLANDLVFATRWLPDDKPTIMRVEEQAQDRMELAHAMMDREAKKRDNYNATGPSVVRIKQTVWKCAALLALYRGEKTIRAVDALTAIYYAETWFNDLFKIVDEAGEGEFQKDCAEIEAYIKARAAGVSETRVFDKFRKLIVRSNKELDERLTHLIRSGRIVPEVRNGVRFYLVNGG